MRRENGHKCKSSPCATTPQTDYVCRKSQAALAALLLFFLSIFVFGAEQAPKTQYYAGPFTASLGPDVMLHVPHGFLFLNEADSNAWARYTRLFNPGHLVGVMVPFAASWSRPDYSIQFRWEQRGFTKEPSIEATYQHLKHGYYLLKISTSPSSIRESDFRFTGMVIQPEYDRKRHLLLFATRQSRENESWEDLQAILYGRNGKLVADLTTRRGGGSVKDYLVSFRSILVEHVTFRRGATYQDYRSGDPLERPMGIPILIEKPR